jgi:hypothetical protein
MKTQSRYNILAATATVTLAQLSPAWFSYETPSTFGHLVAAFG